MIKPRQFNVLLLAFCLWPGGALLRAQPAISSLSRGGVLTASNLVPGSVLWVAYSTNLATPWNTNLAGAEALPVDNTGLRQIPVPYTNHGSGFFRLVEFIDTTPSALAAIPGGSFLMGDTADTNLFGDADPTNIYLPTYYVETNTVTTTLWQTIVRFAVANGYTFDNPGSGNASNQPVQTVNWYDCVKWCNARSAQAGLAPVYYTDSQFNQTYTSGDVDNLYPNPAANGFRLPTEAEWEKAARGGLVGKRFPWGNTIDENRANYYADPVDYPYDLGPYAGYNTNFDGGDFPYTSPPGFFPPNGYGLNDLAGNVDQWCWDWYGTPYGQPGTNNPAGPATGSARVLRGGNWFFDATYCRTAARNSLSPASPSYLIGFRCVRSR
jgi:formylglycine-generating enzyme required for sulfatase activity